MLTNFLTRNGGRSSIISDHYRLNQKIWPIVRRRTRLAMLKNQQKGKQQGQTGCQYLQRHHHHCQPINIIALLCIENKVVLKQNFRALPDPRYESEYAIRI